MQKVLYKKQVGDYSRYLHPSIADYLDKELTETFESSADYDLLAFQWYDIRAEDIEVAQIIIYIDREDLFFLCEDERAFKKCSELFTQDESNERALYLFFVSLLSNDAKWLERLELVITDAEESAAQDSRGTYLESILGFRKQLLRLKRYYEELDTITDHLTANDNSLFTKEGVRHFAIVRNRTEHFAANVMSLRDYVTQMREAYQSQIDIEQNRLMRVFTVVATIFLPLTLITGWYGMNFRYMPELGWRYGYIGVIALSVAVCAALIIWFKHKKWF